MDVLSPFICVHSLVVLIDSSTDSPVHVMLSIHAVRCLPRMRAPGVVSCIISRISLSPLIPHGVTVVC